MVFCIPIGLCVALCISIESQSKILQRNQAKQSENDREPSNWDNETKKAYNIERSEMH